MRQDPLVDWERLRKIADSSSPQSESLRRTPPTQHLRELFEGSRSDNGVAGFKMMNWHRSTFEAIHGAKRGRASEPVADRFLSWLPAGTRLVRLRRRDRARQAVSLARARQSGTWSLGAGESGPRTYFDYLQIARADAWLKREEAGWDRWIPASGLPILEIAYEDLATAPRETVLSVLRFLDVDDQPSVWTPHASQTDRASDLWARRFERRRALPAPIRGLYIALTAPRWLAVGTLGEWRARARRRPRSTEPKPPETC